MKNFAASVPKGTSIHWKKKTKKKQVVWYVTNDLKFSSAESDESDE